MSRQSVTVAQLAEATGLPAGTIRYHCRSGLLAGHASKVGRDWLIPWNAAEAFARDYEPYMTLRVDQ